MVSLLVTGQNQCQFKTYQKVKGVQMYGIVAYGAYIPVYRLSREVMNNTWGGGAGRGEKAVANWDEDSLTMAVEAGRTCLTGMDKGSVDALYFATTTPPYKEKQSASIIAAALDLDENIVAADFTNSVRSGTIALRAALDAVKAGSAKNVLVIAADCRMAAPNSALEPVLADGAAALLVGKDEVAVEIEGSHYLTSEFMDVWRLEYDRIIRIWEDRFILEEGYLKILPKAISTLLKAHGLSTKDFSKTAFYALDGRSHGAMVKKLGLDAKTQVQDPLFDRVGNTGAAYAPMMLVGALEEAKPGDRILWANYGDGADAHVLRVGEGIEKIRDGRSLSKQIQSKFMLENYGKYIKFRGLMEFEQNYEYRTRTSLPLIWRDRNWVYRFHGHKCQKCGKVQFPLQKACMYCQAREEFLDEVPLQDKTGTLFTFSMDERVPVVDPPNVVAAVSLDGGGRFFSQMTDRVPENVKVGMPMELTFRRITEALGVHNYFWKCKPARD
ncbi:hydroxymethylglutaryl-CoA synthase family protein [Chloroflexota bacterium]